jgi:hypothetical protein
MPDGHVFGHIRRVKHLRIAFVARIPPVADEECGRLLGGVSVIVSQNMRIGLQEESNIGVADPLADHLRAYAGFERTGRVGVAQIVEGDPRESCSCREAIETLSDRVGVRWAAVLKGEDVVAGVVVGAEELSRGSGPRASCATLQLWPDRSRSSGRRSLFCRLPCPARSL